MYKKTDANGKRHISFSFNRLVTNTFPNFASDTTNPELSLSEMDLIFDFQTACAKPKQLTPTSLYIAKINDNESSCKKVFDKLVKEGYLTANPDAIHTDLIGKKFASQFAIIPVFAQKRLICLLFAWEEELMRWRLLEEEEAELKVVLEEETAQEGRKVGELEKRLLVIEGLKMVKPSMRKESGRVEHNDVLPAYEG